MHYNTIYITDSFIHIAAAACQEKKAAMKNKVLPFLLAVLLSFPTACSSGSVSSAVSSGISSETASSSAGAVESDVSSGLSLPSAKSSSSAPAAVSSSAPSGSLQPKGRQAVQITVPEGFTLVQIAKRLEAHKICASADFIKAAQTYDFSYDALVAKIPKSANRCYKLEGYLYPDTYEFYVGMKPQDAVGKFLRNAENQIGSKYSYSGMTADQLITLASIIEREADDPDNMRKVSSVFHNRLNAHMILQADSTRDYCNIYLVPQFGTKYNSSYNTYPNRSPGLPAGPICNPGADALSAAAHPADTNFLYFATGTDHNYYYGATQKDRDTLMANAGVTPLYAD